jgi:hypothetical protein
MEDHIVAERRFAFVLRLWTEGGPEDTDARSVLRGSLQRVGSQQVRYFRSLAEVPALLGEMLEEEN